MIHVHPSPYQFLSIFPSPPISIDVVLSQCIAPHRTARMHARTHAHTHTFNGPFSGTTQLSRYQKGKTNLEFTEARESVWQWNQLGCMQVCTTLQTDNHTSTPPLSFLQARCHSCCPTNSVKSTEGNAPYSRTLLTTCTAANQCGNIIAFFATTPQHCFSCYQLQLHI